MLSDQAKSSVENMFAKAAKAGLARGSGDSWNMVPVAVAPEFEGDDYEGLLVVTLSSFQFRIQILLHAEDDQATRLYYGAGDAGDGVSAGLVEAANRCSAAMNNELAQHFAHLGVSESYALNRGCLAYTKELNPQHVSSYTITINESVRLHATLCLCGYGPGDFFIAASTGGPTGTGIC